MKCKIIATDRVLPGKKEWSLQFEGFRRGFNRDTGVLEHTVDIEKHTVQQLANDGYLIVPDLPDLEPLTDRESESWSDPEPEPEEVTETETDPEIEDEEETD